MYIVPLILEGNIRKSTAGRRTHNERVEGFIDKQKVGISVKVTIKTPYTNVQVVPMEPAQIQSSMQPCNNSQ